MTAQEEKKIRRVIRALEAQVTATAIRESQVNLVAQLEALRWVLGEGIFVSGEGSYAELPGVEE